MRIIIVFIITLLTFSCSKKENSKITSNATSQTNLVDTTENKTDVLNENTQYIGFLNKFYFSNKNEAYVELYFNKDNITPDEYDTLEKLTDSLIYQDDENSRRRFPASLASKHFDLRGLSKLKVYDDNNKLVCNAEFVRVEFLNQNISPCFIAVYKTDKEIKSDNCYCISNSKGNFAPNNYSITNDTILTQKLLTKLNEKKPYGGLQRNGKHIRFKDNTTLSVINSEEYSYIIFGSDKDFKILYKSPEPENITSLNVIPLMKNKLPYLLTSNVAPESDVMWDNLLYYDGTKYTNSIRQRVE